MAKGVVLVSLCQLEAGPMAARGSRLSNLITVVKSIKTQSFGDGSKIQRRPLGLSILANVTAASGKWALRHKACLAANISWPAVVKFWYARAATSPSRAYSRSHSAGGGQRVRSRILWIFSQAAGPGTACQSRLRQAECVLYVSSTLH